MTLPFVDGQVPVAADFNNLLYQTANYSNSAAGSASIAMTSANTATAAAGSAVSSASSAAAALSDFRNIYYGPFTTEPATRPNGAARVTGDLYYDTPALSLMIYSGTAWVVAAGGAEITDPLMLLRLRCGVGAYNANSVSGDDEHWIETTNDPSIESGLHGAGLQFQRFNSYGNGGYGGNHHYCRYDGTIASPTSVKNGMFFMSYGYRGWNGSTLSQSAAAFQAVATEDWTTTANGMRFQWEVCANGSTDRFHAAELTANSFTHFGKSFGIGRTPTPQHTNYRILELGVSGSTLRAHVSGGDVAMTNNSYYDTDYRYGVSIPAGYQGAAKYQQDGAHHTWSSAPNGAAGAVCTFTDLMTLDPAGNLAVLGLASADGNILGTREILQNSKSTSYTLVLSDSGKHIYHPPADTTARTWTIPANASVAYPVGTVITFDNDLGAGSIAIACDDTLVLIGVSGGTGTRTLASGGQATAIKVSATRWRISGVGLS